VPQWSIFAKSTLISFNGFFMWVLVVDFGFVGGRLICVTHPNTEWFVELQVIDYESGWILLFICHEHIKPWRQWCGWVHYCEEVG
jgi:hypothetical protein